MTQTTIAPGQEAQASGDIAGRFVSAKELMSSSLGEAFTEDQLEFIAASADVAVYEAGKTILSPSDTAFPAMVVLSGCVTVEGMFGDTVNEIGQGGLIGEIAFIDKKGRTAKVIAKETCRVAILSESLIGWLAKERPDVVVTLLYNLSKELCTKLRWAQRLLDAYDATVRTDSIG